MEVETNNNTDIINIEPKVSKIPKKRSGINEVSQNIQENQKSSRNIRYQPKNINENNGEVDIENNKKPREGGKGIIDIMKENTFLVIIVSIIIIILIVLLIYMLIDKKKDSSEQETIQYPERKIDMEQLQQYQDQQQQPINTQNVPQPIQQIRQNHQNQQNQQIQNDIDQTKDNTNYQKQQEQQEKQNFNMNLAKQIQTKRNLADKSVINAFKNKNVLESEGKSYYINMISDQTKKIEEDNLKDNTTNKIDEINEVDNVQINITEPIQHKCDYVDINGVHCDVMIGLSEEKCFQHQNL